MARLLPQARSVTRAQLDVTHPEALSRAVVDVDVIVHLAAMTDVDACEIEPETAAAINAGGTKNVIGAARRIRARVVYTSTDYVFDGHKPSAYVEDDPVRPLGVYGRTKLEGEQAVAMDPENLVIRTSWVVGGGKNFVRAILDKARTGAELRVVDDQRGRLTFAHRLAEAIVACIREEVSGVLHVTGDGDAASWADVADLALHHAGIGGKVARVTSTDYARHAGRTVAPRPKESVLSVERARSLGIPLYDWREDLERYVTARP